MSQLDCTVLMMSKIPRPLVSFCACLKFKVFHASCFWWTYFHINFRLKFLVQMKTGCVALVMCLNITVDPPDVIKISPCARMECWIGTLVISSDNLQLLFLGSMLYFYCILVLCSSTSGFWL